MAIAGSPGDTLEDVSEYLANAVNSLTAIADTFVRDLAAQRIDLTVQGPDVLNYLTWDYNTELSSLFTLRPGYLTFDVTKTDADLAAIAAIVAPTAPHLDLPTVTVPTLDAERPVITLPTAPGTDVGDAPSDAPALDAITTPDAPLVTLPAVPTFEELNLPVAPSFSLPTFTSEAPANLLSPPTDTFAYVDSGYTSALRDPVTAKLLYDLENGGYGIEAADELALWTRARDRAEQSGRVAVDAAMRQAAQMSFPLPPGALFSALDRARQQLQAEISKANMDIALKRADMYVENRRFTIQQVLELEKISIDLYNAIQERALNAAKAVAEVGIAVYDAGVRNFSAQLEAHKTEAQVFETRIRAEIAKAELFRSQIEAEKLRGEFNQQRAELYQAQLNGIQTVVNLYKSRVEAASVLAQVQTQKIQAFGARVEAYATRVRAKAAEYDMYRAAVQGETAKLDIYKTDVAAYEVKVRAEETRANIFAKNNATLVEQYRARVAQYSALLEGATKKAEVRVAQNNTFVAGQAVNARVFTALTDAVLAGVRTRIESQKMNNEWNISAVESRLKEADFRLREYIATVGNRVEIDKWGAKFYGDQAMAALSGITGLSVKSA